MVKSIHQGLAQKALLPKEHFLDGGYLSAEHLVKAKNDYGMELVGPARPDQSWQAKSKEGFDVTHFQVDWKRQLAICPQGHSSTKWCPGKDIQGKDVINVRFLGKTCCACPVRSQCTRSKAQPRELTLRPQELFVALHERRKTQNSSEFRKRYGTRAGIESTHAQGIRRTGLRRTRYIGLAKTHLQHILTAIAINLIRVDAWFNEVPFAHTRRSRFKRELRPRAA